MLVIPSRLGETHTAKAAFLAMLLLPNRFWMTAAALDFSISLGLQKTLIAEVNSKPESTSWQKHLVWRHRSCCVFDWLGSASHSHHNELIARSSTVMCQRKRSCVDRPHVVGFGSHDRGVKPQCIQRPAAQLLRAAQYAWHSSACLSLHLVERYSLPASISQCPGSWFLRF